MATNTDPMSTICDGGTPRVGEAMLPPRDDGTNEEDGNKQEQPTIGSAVSCSKKGKSNGSQRLKRPMNAFMVWSSMERKRLAEREPHLHNTELSKRLGEMWKGMTEEKKKPYREEAQKLKAKLMKEHPDYKYRPRRRKDINTLRHSGCLLSGQSSGSSNTAQSPTISAPNNFVKLYSVTGNQPGHYGYISRGVCPPSFNMDKPNTGYVYPYTATAYMRPLPQSSFAHFGTAAIHQPVGGGPGGNGSGYSGGYIMQQQQGQGGLPPNSVPAHILSYQQHQQYNPDAIGATVVSPQDNNTATPGAISNDETAGTQVNGVYKDLDQISLHTVVSDSLPNLQNHPPNQLPNEHIVEYGVDSVTTSRDQPLLVNNTSCDKPTPASFTQYTSVQAKMNMATTPLQLVSVTGRNFSRPSSATAIETPPCSPCMTSASIQTFSSSIPSAETKVCTSPHEKHCSTTAVSPQIPPADCHTVNPATFSLVTPSPDSTTPIGGPSPSSDEHYPSEYFMWSHQPPPLYNTATGNGCYTQIKREKECDSQQLPAGYSAPPQSCKSEGVIPPPPGYYQQKYVANNVKSVYPGNMVDYPQYGGCLTHQDSSKGDGFVGYGESIPPMHSDVHDEDSLGSNGGGGGTTTLSHDPPLVIQYQSTISDGICDLPITPDLTPTDSKESIVAKEQHRNVFF